MWHRRRGIDKLPSGMTPGQFHPAYGFWPKVAGHIDPYAALMMTRRERFSLTSVVLGLDGETNELTVTGPDDGLLALGPAGSGKSASVTVINSLLAPGPLVSSSSRSDVYLATALARARIGRVWQLSAQDKPVPGAVQLRFSPLGGCENFQYALRTARRFGMTVDMAASARQHDDDKNPHFRRLGSRLLGVLMYYGATYDKDMEWVLDQLVPGDPHSLIKLAGDVKFESQGDRKLKRVADFLVLVTTRYGGELSGIVSTAADSIECYSTDAALRTQHDPNFNFEDFVRGKPHDPSGLLAPASQWSALGDESTGGGRHETGVYDSVYLTDGDSESEILPIYLEFLYRVKTAAYDYAEECQLGGVPAPVPTTLVLDELAAMPIPDLGRILADSRDRGVNLVGGIQSIAQAIDLYGHVGSDFLTLWRQALVFRGIMDKDTLELLSMLSGTWREPVKGYSETRNPQTGSWEWSSSISLDLQPVIKPEHIRTGHPAWPDAALIVRRDQPHSWVRAVPYFKGDPWAKVLVASAEHARGNDALNPDLPLPPLAKNGNYAYLAALGLEERFRRLQNRRAMLGALGCLRPSTSVHKAKAPVRSGHCLRS